MREGEKLVFPRERRVELTDQLAGLSGVGGPDTKVVCCVILGEVLYCLSVPDPISVHCCLEKQVSPQNGQLHPRGDSGHTPWKGLLGCVTRCQGTLVSFCLLVFQWINCHSMFAQGGQLGGGHRG